jgi:hypothetical protein
MVAPPYGPGWWRSALVNPAPDVHRTFYLFELIKEKFSFTLSLRLMQFSSFYCLPLTLTPIRSLIPVPCLSPELSYWDVSPPKTPPSKEGGVRSSGDQLRGSVLVLWGLDLRAGGYRMKRQGSGCRDWGHPSPAGPPGRRRRG